MSLLMREEKVYFSAVVVIWTALGNTNAVLSFVMAVTLENGIVILRGGEREGERWVRQERRMEMEEREERHRPIPLKTVSVKGLSYTHIQEQAGTLTPLLEVYTYVIHAKASPIINNKQ